MPQTVASTPIFFALARADRRHAFASKKVSRAAPCVHSGPLTAFPGQAATHLTQAPQKEAMTVAVSGRDRGEVGDAVDSAAGGLEE
jgi:hypothetical protein